MHTNAYIVDRQAEKARLRSENQSAQVQEDGQSTGETTNTGRGFFRNLFGARRSVAQPNQEIPEQWCRPEEQEVVIGEEQRNRAVSNTPYTSPFDNPNVRSSSHFDNL